MRHSGKLFVNHKVNFNKNFSDCTHAKPKILNNTLNPFLPYPQTTIQFHSSILVFNKQSSCSPSSESPQTRSLPRPTHISGGIVQIPLHLSFHEAKLPDRESTLPGRGLTQFFPRDSRVVLCAQSDRRASRKAVRAAFPPR